jgi:hypothetical protein
MKTLYRCVDAWYCLLVGIWWWGTSECKLVYAECDWVWLVEGRSWSFSTKRCITIWLSSLLYTSVNQED